MRTIAEIEKDMTGPGHKHVLTGGELRHLLALAKAAKNAWDCYPATAEINIMVHAAREAGLFGEAPK